MTDSGAVTALAFLAPSILPCHFRHASRTSLSEDRHVQTTAVRTTRRARTRMIAEDKSAPGSENPRDSEFVLDGSSPTVSKAQLRGDTANDGEISASFDWAGWAESGSSAEIPMLPFAPGEVLIPGESKRLHLYEARFLTMFENSVVHFNKRFAHVLFAADRAALAAYGTLAFVRYWRRLDVGVLIEVEGTIRLRVSALKRASPHWWGECAFIDDDPVEDLERLRACERRAWDAAQSVIRLCVKLDISPMREKVDTSARTLVDAKGKDEIPPRTSLAGNNGVFVLNEQGKIAAWETRLKRAAQRAADDERFSWKTDDFPDDVLVRRAKALSFAGFEFFPSTPGVRQKALEGRDTIARLEAVAVGLESHAKKLAARVAVQSALGNETDN